MGKSLELEAEGDGLEDKQLPILRHAVRVVSGRLLLGIPARAVHVQDQLKETPVTEFRLERIAVWMAAAVVDRAYSR